MAKKDKTTKKPEDTSLLERHPRTQLNAKSYFNHENGKTIIEDRVPRGDPNPYTEFSPHTADAVTNDDLKSLIVYASEIVDGGIYRYDPDTAYRDALDHAIHDKDGGRYAGKVSADTYGLLLSELHKSSPKPTEKESGQNDPKAFVGKKKEKWSNKNNREGSEMSKSEEIKALKEKLAALEVEEAREANENMAKVAAIVASDSDARDAFKKLVKASVEEKRAGSSKKDTDKDEEDGMEIESCGKKYASDEIIEEIDKIAGEMEAVGTFDMFKIAYQLDKVSDVLSGKKEAATLASDPDEPYMRKFFKAGKLEGDSDESYMSTYNTDISKEMHKPISKKAYSIID